MKTSFYKLLIVTVIVSTFILFTGCGKNESAPEQGKSTEGKSDDAVKVEGGSHVIEVSSEAQFNKLLADNNIVLVDLYADWCGPCRLLKPIIHEIAKEYAGKITVAAVNVDNNEELAKKQGVSNIPDVRVFQSSKEKKKFIGLQKKKSYTDFIDSLLQ